MPLHVPQDGITLCRSPNAASTTAGPEKQIIRLDLAQQTTTEILRAIRNNEKVRLRFGTEPSLQYGKKALPLHASANPFHAELYSKTADDSHHLYFSGKLSHSLEIRRAKQATAKTDHALAMLESSLRSLQEAKASNETSFITNSDEMRHLNDKRKHKPSPLLSSGSHKDRFLNGITRSTPSSPFLGSSSPRLAPTSAPQMPSAPSKDKVRLEAIKIPLIHLLAARPLSAKTLAKNLHAKQDDCDSLLQKLARDSPDSAGKKELKEKSYRDLDVWEFPYRTHDDRQAAIDRAIHAFDRMRIERSDKLWQLLLPVGERGKGKCLSRLNFNKPISKQSAPRASSKTSAPDSDTEQDRGRPKGKSDQVVPRAQSQDPTRKRKVSEKEAMSKQKIRKRPLDEDSDGDKSTSQPKAKIAKTQGKFKSNEIIEDSDEEMEAARDVVVKATSAPRRERSPSGSKLLAGAHSPRPPSLPLPKRSQHKSKLSTSAPADAPKGRLDTQPRQSSPASNLSRTRTNSSPHKRSPLAASPPTNSTDLDTSNSDSSKPPSQSSATSSPPSSSEMPKYKPKNFSPVIAESALPQDPSPAKRKAEHASSKNNDEPPAKRHQTQSNGTSAPAKPSVSTPAINTNITNPINRPGAPLKRNPSSSESLSSPEKPESDQMAIILDKSRRFKTYYARYKLLHEKVDSRQKEGGECDEQDVADLLRMHKRLKEYKDEIWSEHDKLKVS